MTHLQLVRHVVHARRPRVIPSWVALALVATLGAVALLLAQEIGFWPR